ncbi:MULTISPECIES: bifunctional methylenetetrahydrofolate dehydrogenase/methenyltetrahydrofolate cyclohydrolase FolD [unclassified Azospirillum]|uniref:bifunctional methylenetetrahydrofolate dehydrogenase/methenyltetrahydrofolate cyclohydrolase FolD n=1 Tax=unclassified Azospirillum TaxID=2630922 RepID=UPI000B74E73E|nr:MULTISPECIES: bifunctional methylenetetrahydrofolate dehydrogenase/methenyltetrahydrofolate cyclohydrolase FolD [unclassified Azospirillum]SNS31862.1 methylenetetrahydrofolate dehydrogenase (NADP+) / methenyltetrahydrofolate cyclohydrolase [Azospirillum sp. RU38E]SNS50272.1 methylenetetrahydrofolate dehydrogenase (NADP+) / methenyltetrahydrofolate cyclohydrolase [Azospirillum sp. RU37A]
MAEARIIDGKGFAAGLRVRIATAVEELRTRHALVPGLAVVLVGEDPASQIYVRNKGEQTREAGMHSVTHRLTPETSQEELLRLVNQLNNDPSIHGILVQLPLPAHIDTQAVLGAIDPAKDVDGFHVVNTGRLSVGLPALVPCTPLGCMLLLKDTVPDLRGMNAVVVGRSNIVGKPMAQLLLAADCTVTIAHSRTRDLPAVCRQADILVAAVGRPEMVKGDWIKPGAIVIDVGINRVPARDPAAAAAGKTRVVGDVAYAEAAAVAGAITPVPGGVGPMTIACLLANTVTAACRSAGVPVPAGVGL